MLDSLRATIDNTLKPLDMAKAKDQSMCSVEVEALFHVLFERRRALSNHHSRYSSLNEPKYTTFVLCCSVRRVALKPRITLRNRAKCCGTLRGMILFSRDRGGLHSSRTISRQTLIKTFRVMSSMQLTVTDM